MRAKDNHIIEPQYSHSMFYPINDKGVPYSYHSVIHNPIYKFYIQIPPYKNQRGRVFSVTYIDNSVIMATSNQINSHRTLNQMPTINIDDKIRDQIKEIAEESKCSIKGVIYLLLKNKPKAFKQSEVDFCNRLYPTREVLSNNWDSFWTILTSYINSHPDSHYKAKELAEIASCSELQMQSLIDLLVLEKYIKVGGPGYIKCRKGNINLTLKEARSTSYDHRANDIIDLLEKNPEGLTSKDLEDRLNLTRSQVKGSAKNPLVKSRVLVKDDLWILSETPLKKTIKKPIKKPLKRVIKRHKTQ